MILFYGDPLRLRVFIIAYVFNLKNSYLNPSAISYWDWLSLIICDVLVIFTISFDDLLSIASSISLCSSSPSSPSSPSILSSSDSSYSSLSFSEVVFLSIYISFWFYSSEFSAWIFSINSESMVSVYDASPSSKSFSS